MNEVGHGVKRQHEIPIDDKQKCPCQNILRRVLSGLRRAAGDRGSRPVVLYACAPGGLFCPEALDVTPEFDDYAVVNHPIDHRCCRQRILEDLIPV